MKYFIFLLLLLIVSCQSKDKTYQKSILPEIKYNEYVNKQIEKANSLNELFAVDKVVKLESKKESFLSGIEDIIYRPEENRIIILDGQGAVFVFEAEGKYLNQIGKKGFGPGEYQDVKAIAYGKGVLVLYSTPFKLLFYKLNGSFIKEIELFKQKWFFSAYRMVASGNDLYVYSNNEMFNVGPDGKKHRVFKIKNMDSLDTAFGEIEETFDFSGGDIISFNNRIIFSSVFDGNIYQIYPDAKNSDLLLSLGPLCDLSGLKKSPDKISYIIKNIKNLDSFVKLGEVNNYLFIRRHNKIEVADNTGKVLNNGINTLLDLPKDHISYNSRLGGFYYKKGIILAATKKGDEMKSAFQNPSLIFYSLKTLN